MGRKIDLRNKTDCPVIDQCIQSSYFITKISLQYYVKKGLLKKKKDYIAWITFLEKG